MPKVIGRSGTRAANQIWRTNPQSINHAKFFPIFVAKKIVNFTPRSKNLLKKVNKTPSHNNHA